MTDRRFDVVVVGAGVAGSALAESLVTLSDVSVLVCDAAPLPGAHSSGRSVAVFDPLYGNPSVQVLTAASRSRLESGILGEGSLLAARDLIHVATTERLRLLDDAFPLGTHGAERLDERELISAFPALRPGALAQGVRHLGGADLDVDRLHQGLIASARQAGASVELSARVNSFEWQGSGWSLQIGGGAVHCGVVVDAAGGWADDVAVAAGAAPRGAVAHRRSVGVARAVDLHVAQWAMLADIGSGWYIKPDGAAVLLSPADATPVPPGDPKADELELARAIDAINAVTTLDVRSLSRTWAGLRTYTADETPLIGPDPDVPSLFWHAAFGGFGLQVSVAAGRLAAEMILGVDPHLDPAPYAPSRLEPTR